MALHGTQSFIPPTLMVASISDALAGRGPAASPATQSAWFGAPQLKWPPRPRFFERTGTRLPEEPASESTAPQQPSTPAPQAFQMGRRVGMTPHAAKHIQHVMQARLDPPMPKPLFSFLNHHILPMLAYVAVAQHHAMLQLSERMRGWRRRNPFQKRHKEQHPAGESSMHSCNGPKPTRHARTLYENARQLERSLDPLSAARAFMSAVQADPRQAEWLSLAAKQWSDAMYMDNVNPATAQQYNRTAIETATQAMELAPTAAHSYIARCVSRGRLALMCDNKTKVHLAREACDDAARALELEPRNDYAHHLMGRWHFEMAGLSAIARTLVRLLYGTSLMSGSYSAAAEHYRQATQLAPRTLVHRAELGRSLIKLGRRQEGIAELQEALACEVEDLNSHLTKQEVAKQLNGLLNKGLLGNWAA